MSCFIDTVKGQFAAGACSIPRDVKPSYYSTGKYCAEGQSGPVWFLTGTHKYSVAGTVLSSLMQSAEAVNTRDIDKTSEAPSVISGDNVYIAWWNGTEGQPDKNVEILFRASNDGGATFGEKINLSNSTDADSIRAQISISRMRKCACNILGTESNII
jgi:hypothetical protein